jgi:serine/threonine protein kinase
VDAKSREKQSMPREVQACVVCGANFSATAENQCCPVCLLRSAREVETNEPPEERLEPTPARETHRLEHYELVMDKDGQPIELGRGAMGVTYKAFDVDLHCPVTLKVINEKYLGDEAARQRFLREARAAASVRHPNVASVFHLGRKGRDYFYAMEFVEGETLDSLIKRLGALEVKLALEITRQVASGLSAVHKKSLVHRDIKPSNVMVSFEDEGAVTAKIIDLGLAKIADESGAQSTISANGAFAGTPEFASPEQIVGGEVDIRSDLYSLGISLWQMLTGEVPFTGPIAVVMAQHQQAALPLEKLHGLPESVVSLVEVLLDKDPARRFQTPAELLKALATIMGAFEDGSTITFTSSGRVAGEHGYSPTRKPTARGGPEKISIARLPVTGSDLFGREEDITFLNDAWSNPDVNVVTIVAWAGVGKSTLVNHWLRTMAAERYRSAELVYGWSFYWQGTTAGTSTGDEFIDAALTWFGDPDARIGTAWEKGERLAKLIASRRTLMILDGLEPLQNPPGPQEGRLREPSLQALLKELAVFNSGLCLITTRLPVGDIADHEHTSALRRDLDHLSNDAGAALLRALGVQGDRAELRSASQEFRGHCLALTLLGSYLTDAYQGDIRCRSEVLGHLGDDIRQGVHARKVMESYQSWFGKGPELSVLRMLGLFDRPVDERAVELLLKPPVIPDLTDSLTGLSPSEWRTILARLRRVRLLAGEDPHHAHHFDAHPLVREYFGEQLRHEQRKAWKECNHRLFTYYRTHSAQLPQTLKEMEPLFLAVICGCRAGLFRDALHKVYIPRIQRGNASFTSKVLGAQRALLSLLVHFFEDGRWGSLAEADNKEQNLTAEDQLFLFMQAAQYLAATRGLSAPEARICYERAEFLCRSLDRSELLYVALMGLWRSSVSSDTLAAATDAAERVYSLAEKQNNPALMLGGCLPLAITLYFSGDFEAGHEYTRRGLQIWRSGIESPVEEVDVPAVSILCFEALFEWHAGETIPCDALMAESISLATALNDMHGLAVTLWGAGWLAYLAHNRVEVERCASRLVELATRQHFVFWLAGGKVFSGWARTAAGDTVEGISWINEGIQDLRTIGAIQIPSWLLLKADALHLADRTAEALEAIEEAQAHIEIYGERWHLSELYRLRALLLAATGGDNTKIEDSFHAAISTAKQQKSLSLEKRAEASYAAYRRHNPSVGTRDGLRLPLN